MLRTDLKLGNVRSFAGRQGTGFSCTVLIEGKKVADVINEANGGEFRITWKDDGESEKALKELARLTPPYPFPGGDPLPWNVDMLIEDEFERMEEEKRLRRLCKTKTLFRLKGGPEDQIWQRNEAYTPEVAARIRGKHGDHLAEIINERPGIKVFGKQSPEPSETEDNTIKP